MTKPHMSFRPKPDLADAIKLAAEQDRRPVSQFLANLIEDAIAQRREVTSKPEAQHAA